MHMVELQASARQSLISGTNQMIRHLRALYRNPSLPLSVLDDSLLNFFLLQLAKWVPSDWIELDYLDSIRMVCDHNMVPSQTNHSNQMHQ